MKRILMSLVVIGVVGSIALASTGAFFSDTETSTNNTLQAGEVDLRVGFQGYYNKEVDGNPNAGSWIFTDLSQEKFFDFDDIKPGDTGAGIFTLQVNSNDSWACLTVDNLFDDEMTCTEPETEAEAIDGQCIAGNEGEGNGDLASNLYFTVWLDDGDGIWQNGETFLLQNQLTDLLSLANGTIPIADSTTGDGSLLANDAHTIAYRWCAGEMTIDTQAETISCDGQVMGNESQTDKVTADISFNVVQSRNNNEFRCNEVQPISIVDTFEVSKDEPVLNGTAYIDAETETLELMTDCCAYGGSAFYSNNINFSNFKATFDFTISRINGAGGDGFSFTLLKDGQPSYLGNGAGDLGYVPLSTQPSIEGVTIEFDTHNNYAPDQFSDNHVGLNLDGKNTSTELNDLPYELEDNGTFTAEVIGLNGNQIEVYLSNPSIGLSRTKVIDYNSTDMLNFDGIVGFTAGSGAVRNYFSIDNFNFQT